MNRGRRNNFNNVKGEKMKEEMLRCQAMEYAGKLAKEERGIKELGVDQSPDYTLTTTFLTIFCC